MKKEKKGNPPAGPGAKVEVGQVWQEVDNRFRRIVTVVAVRGEQVYIRCGNRQTSASLHRFNGRHGGYKLVPAPSLRPVDLDDYDKDRDPMGYFNA